MLRPGTGRHLLIALPSLRRTLITHQRSPQSTRRAARLVPRLAGYDGRRSDRSARLPHTQGDSRMIRYARPSLYLTLMLVFAGRAAAVPALTTTVAIGPRPVAVAVERN